MKFLTETHPSLQNTAILLIRWTIGVILFVVGSGKVLGWFGGMGLEATIQAFGKAGFSAWLIYLSSFTEFIGGILLILGLFTRPILIAVIINMLVATISMWPGGFFTGARAVYPFLVLVCSIVIFLTGPMSYSIDALIQRKPAASRSGYARSSLSRR